MHLDRYFVATGEQVKAGETIGIVGRSGVRRSPPHLHFEVRVDDRFKDPWRYFTDTIIPPNETLTHRYNLRSQKRACARARAQRAARSPPPTHQPCSPKSLSRGRRPSRSERKRAAEHLLRGLWLMLAG